MLRKVTVGRLYKNKYFLNFEKIGPRIWIETPEKHENFF